MLSATDAMTFVRERGRAMAAAAAVTATGMIAVLGGDPEVVGAKLAEHGLTAANNNGGGQLVAAGTLEELEALRADPPAGAKLVALKVAGAFHTSHMAPGVQRLAELAPSLNVADPAVDYVSNKDGEVVRSGAEVLARLVAQVSNPVRWDLCMETLQQLGVDLRDRDGAGRHADRPAQAQPQGRRHAGPEDPRRPGQGPRAGGRAHRGGRMSSARIQPNTGAAYARIHGVGGYRPVRVIPNSEVLEWHRLLRRVDPDPFGITERRWAGPGETVAEMSVTAAAQGDRRSPASTPAQIGGVIVATVTHLMQTPAVATEIAERLGAAPRRAFDISAACAGFCHGLSWPTA